MIRAQIRFDEQEYDATKRHAEQLGISFAKFVRRAVRQSLVGGNDKPCMLYAGFVASGDRRSSQTIDEILYDGDLC